MKILVLNGSPRPKGNRRLWWMHLSGEPMPEIRLMFFGLSYEDCRMSGLRLLPPKETGTVITGG